MGTEVQKKNRFPWDPLDPKFEIETEKNFVRWQPESDLNILELKPTDAGTSTHLSFLSTLPPYWDGSIFLFPLGFPDPWFLDFTSFHLPNCY